MQTLSFFMNRNKMYRPWRDAAFYVSILFANVLCGGFLRLANVKGVQPQDCTTIQILHSSKQIRHMHLSS